MCVCVCVCVSVCLVCLCVCVCMCVEREIGFYLCSYGLINMCIVIKVFLKPSAHSFSFSLSLFAVSCTNEINPLTFMLVTSSLPKRPIKVPNLKPFRLFFARARESRISIKMHSVVSRLNFVIGPPDNYTVWRRVCTLFIPEILQAGAVKGLKFGFREEG